MSLGAPELDTTGPRPTPHAPPGSLLLFATLLLSAVAVAVAAAVAVIRRRLFFDVSPMLNALLMSRWAAARSLAGSPSPLPVTEPSKLTPRRPCSTSPHTRASACARCATSPSLKPTSKCVASASSFNLTPLGLRSMRAMGRVSTKRHESGSSRPSLLYSARKNTASNDLALCATSSTWAPPPRRRASSMNSSSMSATCANDGTAGADTMGLEMPVRLVMT
mmetsp:Transcript_21977/g.54394  ORF Transcript_21977/g.54394 Transcript_21977/m.54394 type:complete len:221 (+) Transcript_21977:2868-3530(+)